MSPNIPPKSVEAAASPLLLRSGDDDAGLGRLLLPPAFRAVGHTAVWNPATLEKTERLASTATPSMLLPPAVMLLAVCICSLILCALRLSWRGNAECIKY